MHLPLFLTSFCLLQSQNHVTWYSAWWIPLGWLGEALRLTTGTVIKGQLGSQHITLYSQDNIIRIGDWPHGASRSLCKASQLLRETTASRYLLSSANLLSTHLSLNPDDYQKHWRELKLRPSCWGCQQMELHLTTKQQTSWVQNYDLTDDSAPLTCFGCIFSQSFMHLQNYPLVFITVTCNVLPRFCETKTS